MDDSNVRIYTAKNGAKQYKPSLALIEEMSECYQGFCLACGELADRVEPDARKYMCDDCGALKVYGPDELVLMGLTF